MFWQENILLVKEEWGGGGIGEQWKGQSGENSTGRKVLTSPAVCMQSLSLISEFLRLACWSVWLCFCRGFGGPCNHMVKSSGYSRLRSLFYHLLMSWLRLNLRNAIFRLARRTGVFRSGRLGGLLTPVTRSLAWGESVQVSEPKFLHP